MGAEAAERHIGRSLRVLFPGKLAAELVPARFCLPPLISHGPLGRDSFAFYGIADTGSYWGLGFAARSTTPGEAFWGGKMELTKKELAGLAGYTYRRLFDIDKGLAKDKKLFVEGENGKYDAAAFVQRWVDYQVGEATGKSMGLEEAKAVHEQVKIEKTRLEVARMQGELIDVNEVRSLWAGVIKTAVGKLLQLPGRVTEEIYALESREAIAGILDREVRACLEEIADTPLPEEAEGGSGAESRDEAEEDS